MTANKVERPSRAGIGVSLAVWFGTVAASLIIFQIVVAASGHSGEQLDRLPFWLYPTISMVSLWLPTIGALWWVSQRFLTGRFRDDFGFRFAWVDLVGIPIGIACQLVVLKALYWPLEKWFPGTFSSDRVEHAARKLTDTAHGGWRVVLVVAVVVCAPVVEELLYRALVLGSISARLPASAAVVAGAAWFAAAHFQAVQFLGLFAFGLVLGACWRRTGRVGMGVLAHAAFNATSLVMLWPKH
jgi:membrane protease YdiL (CAAX protease family)